MAKPINPFILFWKFCKIGIITFGGGFVMIPLIEREVVQNGWMTQEDVADMIALSQSIPGAVAVNMALFCGHRIGKAKGAAIAAFGVISPSILLLILIAAFFSRFQEYSAVQNTFIGVLCAVVALIIKSVYSMAKLAILDIPTIIITIITVVGLLVFKSLSPVFFIIGGVIVGLLFYYLFPKKARQLQLKDGEIDD